MSKPTFRHTFSRQFVEVLNNFSKLHQNDDRKVFKSEWEAWTNQNDIKTMIQCECESLRASGFDGDVLDKMFKSCRYYFRNKSPEENNDKKQRKPYVALSKSILQHMDEHIKMQVGLRPEDAYNSYCNQFLMKIKDEIQALALESKESIDDIYNKYKKTYKNRFYVLSKKQ